MAAATNAAIPIVDLDVVPMIECLADLLGRYRIRLAQVFQGGVRKHHAPTKSVIGPVAFDDSDFVTRIAELHQQTEVQACRPPADTYYFHAISVLAYEKRKVGRRPPPLLPLDRKSTRLHSSH